ncbi:hypothetical protein GCG21_15035 [Pseudactinotalea sp. HY160]|uniref:hypothetical protein n=1 Tax=Pseudactinotalea sp. HY160 TaxID=2654490 RepID=UPI00128E5145|nr:hypothetical protein [Pseudactinotalea sp. HY160]MPV51298.1 hypothetical protein [Pseudactinotalea sp. HY160]
MEKKRPDTSTGFTDEESSSLERNTGTAEHSDATRGRDESGPSRAGGPAPDATAAADRAGASGGPTGRGGAGAAEQPDGPTDSGSSLEREDDDLIYVRRSQVRRTPKYGRFIGVGVLLGALVTLVLAQIGDVPDGGGTGYSRTDLTLVLALVFVPLGAIVGGVVAMVLDRRNNRRR